MSESKEIELRAALGLNVAFEWNPFHEPEKCGLAKIAELDDDDLSYEYSTAVLWRLVPDGAFFFAHDEGCSCPTPFEDYSELASPTSIESLDQLRREVGDFLSEEKRKAFFDAARAAGLR